MRARRWIEFALWSAAVSCLVYYIASRTEIAIAQAVAIDDLSLPVPGADTERPDPSLWSDSRLRRFREALDRGRQPPPLGRLRIPAAAVDVMVFDGIDDAVLDIGAGRVPGTARFGGAGNLAIAAHRDGFFRGLKDVSIGDEIEILMAGKSRTYRVDKTFVVEPDDMAVLAPTETTGVTLITCYPFYFVGSAPQRFIVHAGLIAEHETNIIENQQE